MIRVTFAGHRNVFNSGAVREQVDAAIASILTYRCDKIERFVWVID